jgi:hypothetical protein
MENPWFVFAWGGFVEGGRNSFLKAFPSQDDAIEYVSHLLNEDYNPQMLGSRKFRDVAANKSWIYMQLWNVETDEHYMLFEKWKQQPDMGQAIVWRRPVPFEQDNVPQPQGVRGRELVGVWMDEEGDRNMDIIQRLIEDENHRQQNVLLRDVPGFFAAEQRAQVRV